MKKTLLSLLFLTIFTSLFSKTIALSNEKGSNKFCSDENTEAIYELEESWIIICNQNESKNLIQFDKFQQQELMNLTAFGEFPTYGAIAGELSDPNSKIYNISPFDLKLIQASIIKSIIPVTSTLHKPTGTTVNILSGEKEQEAMESCLPNEPVQLFETATDNIYICIEAIENDENSIDLTYIQKSKDNSYTLITRPAKLSSSTTYGTDDNQTRQYRVNYKGLEIYDNNQLIETIPVKTLHIASPDFENVDTDNAQ